MATLDSLHQKKVKQLEKVDGEIKEMKNEVASLKVCLDAKVSISMNRKTDAEIREQFQLEDRLDVLQSKITRMEENNPFVDYYLNTGDLLCEYYSNMDTISKGDDSKRKRTVKDSTNDSSSNHKCVIDFFSANTKRLPVKKDRKEIDHHVNDEYEEDEEVRERNEGNQDEETMPIVPDEKQAALASETVNDGKSTVKKKYMSRQVLLDQYLQLTEPHYLSIDSASRTGETETMTDGMEYICPDCGHVRMLFNNEAIFVCQNVACGRMDTILIDANKPAYKDIAHDSSGSYYSYKRINHFNEWLAQFQAKETTDIPDDVYNRILIELKKERVNNVLKITQSKMKDILKRLKLNKYYEHIPHIINRLNGQPAPVMDRATEEKLRNMFKEVQAPFIKHCPSDRKNFLSYSYVLHKFCELLELDDFLHCFQLLKSREKLHHQDKIWEKICHELRWEFIKSI